MSLKSNTGKSPFIKMRQVYWEAKQTFNKSLGQREDNCIISSDSDLDTKLDLLQAADNSFNYLMAVLLDYRKALQKFIDTQDNLGLVLIEYGTKDITTAGKLMCMSGKTISKAAQRQSLLKTSLMYLFHEVQTFQFKATADALQTVAKMEKARKSYRSGLMWMKNESEDLDPDVNKKLKNYRKVQEHMRHLKVRFDGIKLETMQKIDLFLLSRSNLFSHTLVPYCKSFKKICKYTMYFMEVALKNIPHSLSYNFVTLKELNQYSKVLQSSFQLFQTTNQTSKQNSEKKKPERTKHSLISHASSKAQTLKASSVCTLTLTKDYENCQNDKCHTNDNLLIDLNGKEHTKNLSFTETAGKRDNYVPVPKYSDDLQYLNLGPEGHTQNQLSLQNTDLKDEYESLLNLLDPIPQEQSNIKEPSDLHFWALIQSFGMSERSSKTFKPKDREKDSPLMPEKSSAKIQSFSKWNDILVQFDPFADEFNASKKDEMSLC